MNKSPILECVTFIFLLVHTSSLSEESDFLQTLDGKEFQTVKILRIENGKVIISHSKGLATLDLDVLPTDFRTSNGILPGFDEIKGNYIHAVELWAEGFIKLNSRYEAALQRLEDEFHSENRDSEAKQVKKERESFREYFRAEQSELSKLAEMQRTYDRLRSEWSRMNSEKLVPITKKYLEMLISLQVRATKDNQLDYAVAAKSEWERFQKIADDTKKIQVELGVGPAILDARRDALALAPDGDNTKKRTGVMRIFVAGEATALEMPTQEQCEDVIEMHGNWETWAALNKDGRLISSKLDGEQIPEDHKPVLWFRAGAGMVTVFFVDGSFSVFGNPANPLDRPPETLGTVTQLGLDRGSGIALLKSGDVRVWGSMYPETADRKEIEDQFANVRFVSASEKIAWAVDADGKVWSWSNGTQPRIIKAHDDIASFSGGKTEYLILTSKGVLEGGSITGESPVKHVPENLRLGKSIRTNYWGYALQFKEGHWFTWGGPAFSAPIHSQIQQAGPLIDLEISATSKSFLVMGLRR